MQKTCLQERDLNHKFEYSKQLLEAQKEDLKDQRKHSYKSRNSTYIFSGVIMLIVFLFLGFCLQTDHANIALNIIEKVTTLSLGAIGGYYYGINKVKAAKDEQYANYEEVQG